MAAAGATLGSGARVQAQAAKGPTLAYEQTDDALRLKLGPVEVLRYQLQRPKSGASTASSACYFHPLATPKGTVVTDVGPADHRYHRGLFLAWGDVEGDRKADYWGSGQWSPLTGRRIVNQTVETRPPNLGTARFRTLNAWEADGRTLIHEETRASVFFDSGATVLSLAVQLKVDAPITLGRRALGGLAIRTRTDGEVIPIGAQGPVRRPAANEDDPSKNWPDAPWYGFHLKLRNRQEATVALTGSSKNPETTWYVVPKQGLLNPSIVAPRAMRLTPDKPLVLRYWITVGDGAPQVATLNEQAARWHGGVQ